MTENRTDAIVVLVTAANGEEATRLAEMLVGAQLAACVQIIREMESVFRWKGKVEREAEVLLIIKTLSEKFDELEREVRALHSYETPEIVALPLVNGSAAYLDWLAANVNHGRESIDTKNLTRNAASSG